MGPSRQGQHGRAAVVAIEPANSEEVKVTEPHDLFDSRHYQGAASAPDRCAHPAFVVLHIGRVPSPRTGTDIPAHMAIRGAHRRDPFTGRLPVHRDRGRPDHRAPGRRRRHPRLRKHLSSPRRSLAGGCGLVNDFLPCTSRTRSSTATTIANFSPTSTFLKTGTKVLCSPESFVADAWRASHLASTDNENTSEDRKTTERNRQQV